MKGKVQMELGCTVGAVLDGQDPSVQLKRLEAALSDAGFSIIGDFTVKARWVHRVHRLGEAGRLADAGTVMCSGDPGADPSTAHPVRAMIKLDAETIGCPVCMATVKAGEKL